MSRRGSKILLALLLLLFLAPVALLLAAAFVPANTASELLSGHPAEIRLTWDQWRAALSNAEFLRAFANSARIAIPGTLLCLPVALCAGLWLARSAGPLRSAAQTLYLLAMLTPFQIIMLPLYQLTQWTNTYDTLLPVIALIAFSPIGILMIRFLIGAIPKEQWQAVALETRSQAIILRKIVLPQIMSGIVLLALLTFSEGWNTVEPALILLSSSGTHQPLSLLLNDITAADGQYVFAGSALYALPALALYLCVALYAVRHQRLFG